MAKKDTRRSQKSQTSRDAEYDPRYTRLKGAEQFFDYSLPCGVTYLAEKGIYAIDFEGGIPLKCWRPGSVDGFCNGQFLSANAPQVSKKHDMYCFYCQQCYGSLYLNFKDLEMLISKLPKEQN